MTQEEIDALVAENEQLKGKVSELEAKLAEIDASKAQEEEQKMLSEDETIVEAACTEKKIGAELKNHYLNLMKKDREGIRNLIKELPVIEPRRAIDDIRNSGKEADKTPKQIFTERLKSNFYKNNKEAYKADFKKAFNTEPKI